MLKLSLNKGICSSGYQLHSIFAGPDINPSARSKVVEMAFSLGPIGSLHCAKKALNIYIYIYFLEEALKSIYISYFKISLNFERNNYFFFFFNHLLLQYTIHHILHFAIPSIKII